MNVSNPKMLLIEYEANNGLCHVYMDGRNFRRVELTNAARVDAAAVTLRGRLPPGEQLRRQKAGADVADRCQPPVRPRESAARQPIDTPHICRGRDPPANFHSGAPAPRPSSAAPAHRSLRRRKAGLALAGGWPSTKYKIPCLQWRFPSRGRACRIYSQRRRCNQIVSAAFRR
jgi:hypothetical protein